MFVLQHDSGSYCTPYSSTPPDANGNFIMFASATSGDRPNNSKFSPCSKDNVTLVLDNVLAGRNGKVAPSLFWPCSFWRALFVCNARFVSLSLLGYKWSAAEADPNEWSRSQNRTCPFDHRESVATDTQRPFIRGVWEPELLSAHIRAGVDFPHEAGGLALLSAVRHSCCLFSDELLRASRGQVLREPNRRGRRGLRLRLRGGLRGRVLPRPQRGQRGRPQPVHAHAECHVQVKHARTHAHALFLSLT